MKNLEGLNSYTGTVTATGDVCTIQFHDGEKLRKCFLDASTQFFNILANDVALKSIRSGLTINIRIAQDAKDDAVAPYASINYK